MDCKDCKEFKRYKEKVPTATECPSKGKTMKCGKCGKIACETEILINFGVCDACMEKWLKEDGLL